MSPQTSARAWHSRFVGKPGRGQASGTVAPGGHWALIRSVAHVAGRLGWLTMQMMAASRLRAFGWSRRGWHQPTAQASQRAPVGAEASVNA